jgi:exopolysaccharide biosynthesis polyprenyl glycosylphosphotransferase
MISEQEKYFSFIYLFSDSLSILISYTICAPLSFKLATLTDNPFLPPFNFYSTNLKLPFYWDYYLDLLPFIFIVALFSLNLTLSYHRIEIPKVKTIIGQTGIACFVTAVIFFIFSLLYPPLRNGIFFMSVFIPLAWALFASSRIIVFLLVSRKQIKGNPIKFLLIVGTYSKALKAANFFNTYPELGIRVTGLLITNRHEVREIPSHYKVMGGIEDLDSVLRQNIVDCALFAGGLDNLVQIRSIARRCEIEGIDFAFTLSAFGEKFGDIVKVPLDGTSAVFLKSGLRSPEKLFLKRLLDILISTALIILSLPLWIIIPILIKKDSHGPAFFCQERVGKNGRRFIMYKFRTMIADAEKMQEKMRPLNEVDGPAFKMKNDPRVTRFGRFLRKASLDEFPQLFNVLKGDMSMVGPRPPVIEEVLHYNLWERKRLSVVPGITCLWQVSGRSELKFNEWMKLDIQYIENWSLTLDFKILLRTIPAVLSFKGAQ